MSILSILSELSKVEEQRKEQLTDRLVFEAHCERVNKIHKANNVSTTHITNAGRLFTAQTARAHGATIYGTKALGSWSKSGSFQPCYDRAFPIDALLGAAMFSGQKPEDHFLAQVILGEPPFSPCACLHTYSPCHLAVRATLR